MNYTFDEKTKVKYSEADAVNHAKAIARNGNKEQKAAFGQDASKGLTLTLPELNARIQSHLNENFVYKRSGY